MRPPVTEPVDDPAPAGRCRCWPRSPPGAGRAGRRPGRPTTRASAEFRPEAPALPRFYVWTLGCQMNRSDSEEMAGRLLAAGCAEAPASMDAPTWSSSTPARSARRAEQKVIGRQGQLAKLKARQPGAARRPDRLLGPRARPGRPRAGAIPAVDLFLRPDEEPELVDRLGLASAQAPIGLRTSATAGRRPLGRADRRRRRRSPRRQPRRGAVGGRRGPRASRRSRAWLPIVYGCDKTCTYCIVPFSRGPERSRPFDEIVAEARALAAAGYREVTLLGQNVNSYGHDLPAEARFAAHPRPSASAGRQLDLRTAGRTWPSCSGRSTGSATADGRPAIPRLRFVTSHPWDLSDRLIERWPTARRSASTSTCRSSRATTRSCAGWAASTRSSTTSSGWRGSATAVPGIAISTDVIVGFCGETEASSRPRCGCSRRSATTRSSRPPTRPARDAGQRTSPTTCPPAEKRRRLNELLGAPGGDRARAQPRLARARRSRSSSTRSCRRAATTTTTTTPRRAAATHASQPRGRGAGSHLSGRTAPEQARPPDRDRRPGRRSWSTSGSSTPARTRCAGLVASTHA